jgi:hypothetical protein
MAQPHLFVATPCYGGQLSTLCMRSLLALADACAERGIRLDVEMGGGEALISRWRRAVLALYLSTEATHLLFVDADIGFAPEAVFRLLAAGKDVIGGAYPRKAQPPGGGTAWEVDPLPGGALSTRDVQEVAATGAGFLLVSRAAARRITDAHPELRAKLGDLGGAVVPEAAMVFDNLIEPQTGRYLGDYQAFCRRWRALGGQVWADFDAGLTHLGEVERSA